jgi:hypothetical protein
MSVTKRQLGHTWDVGKLFDKMKGGEELRNGNADRKE